MTHIGTVAVILIISLLGLAYCAEVQIKVESLTTAADKDYYCVAKKFSTLVGNTKDYHITQMEGFTSNQGQLDYVHLWNCGDNSDYAEFATKECGDSLPSLDKCQLMYGWQNTTGKALVLPSDAGFKTGDGNDHNELILVVKFNTGSVGPATIGVTFTYTDSLRTYDAGIMSTGPDPDRLDVPGNVSRTYGSVCPNDCATVEDWWIFSSTPYIRFATIYSYVSAYGRYSRELASVSTANQLITTGFINDKTQPKYETSFVTQCTFPSDTRARPSGDTEDSSACLAYFNYYPRKNGIKKCHDNSCSNRSGNANYRGNIIINYVAISFAAGIIGVIIGVTLHLTILYIIKWFENNSARFACKNIKYMINPLWWYREYKPLDEEEGGDKKKEDDKEDSDSD